MSLTHLPKIRLIFPSLLMTHCDSPPWQSLDVRIRQQNAETRLPYNIWTGLKHLYTPKCCLLMTD